MKGTPASAAITRASSVLPVPGKNRKSKQALGVARTRQYGQSVPRSKDRWGVCDRPHQTPPTSHTHTTSLPGGPASRMPLGRRAPSLPYLAGALSMSTSSCTSRLARSIPVDCWGLLGCGGQGFIEYVAGLLGLGVVGVVFLVVG